MTSKEYLSYSDFKEKVALIRISKFYRDDMSELELYECTRGYWKRTIENISDVKIALAIFEGVVKEVYEVESWHKSGFLPMQTIPTQYLDDRVEFVGKIAEENLRNKYKGKSATQLYQKGEANPIKVLVPRINDINFPMKPKSMEVNDGLSKVVCGNCDYKFAKAKRCPICGQLIKYDGD